VIGGPVLASLTEDTPVRWRAHCANLTAMTPDQFRVNPEAEDRAKSRSPAMRNGGHAFTCSAFPYEPGQLTVFPGAGIAGKSLPSEIPSKNLAWGRRPKIRHGTNRYFSEACAFRQ